MSGILMIERTERRVVVREIRTVCGRSASSRRLLVSLDLSSQLDVENNNKYITRQRKPDCIYLAVEQVVASWKTIWQGVAMAVEHFEQKKLFETGIHRT